MLGVIFGIFVGVLATVVLEALAVWYLIVRRRV